MTLGDPLPKYASPVRLPLLDSAHAHWHPSMSPVWSAAKIRRALHYALYDWTREMPRPKRLITWAGILIQGYAIYAGFARTLVWPWIWPPGAYLYLAVFLLYFF